MKLLDILKLTEREKQYGIWLLGKEKEGEFKSWWMNNRGLFVHSFWRGGKLHGKYKHWNIEGKLITYCLYKEGKWVKDYLK